jgi:hypothetical protein
MPGMFELVRADADDTASGANELALNGTAVNEITDADPVDWWKIYVPHDYGVLTVTVDIDISGEDLDLALYASDATTQLDISETTTTHEECETTISTAGWYYAKVYQYSVGDESTYTIGNTYSAEVNQPPVAIIDSPTYGETYLDTEPITFDASSSYDPNDDPLAYTWYRLLSEPPFIEILGNSVIFSVSLDVGSYNVYLEVSDGEYTDTTNVEFSVVHNNPPNPVISAPADPSYFEVGDLIMFDASGSSDPDGDAITFNWSSNIDGHLGSGISITTTLSEGVHTITLTVTDVHGASATTAITVIVEVPNNPPTIEVTSPPPEGVTVDTSFTITWVGYDEDSDDTLTVDIYYDVDKDPGSKKKIASGLPNSPSSYDWNTTYVSEGSYWICIRIRDNHGATALSYSMGQVTVDHNDPPSAPTNIQPDNTHELMPVLNWTASIDPDVGEQITYHINIGASPHGNDIVKDATTLEPEFKIPVELSYGSGINTYYIAIYAQDARGLKSDTTHDTINIVNHPPSECKIELVPAEPTTKDNLECVIISESEDPDGDPIEYRYAWYKKPPNSMEFTAVTDLTGNVVACERTARGEIWKCVVTPTDTFIDGESTEATVEIKNTPPTPSIDAPISGEEILTQTVFFDATSTTDIDGDTLSFTWESNIDGWLSDEVTFTTTLSAGTHKILLTVSDGVNIEVTQVIIKVVAPNIEFEIEFMPQSPQAGDNVNITIQVTNRGGESSKLQVNVFINQTVIYTTTIESILPDDTKVITCAWENVPEGTHELTVDVGGNRDSVQIVVAPAVQIDSEGKEPVSKPTSAKAPRNNYTWLILVIIILAIAATIGVFLFIRYWWAERKVEPVEIQVPEQRKVMPKPPVPSQAYAPSPQPQLYYVTELQQLLAKTIRADKPQDGQESPYKTIEPAFPLEPQKYKPPPEEPTPKEAREKVEEVVQEEIHCHICNGIIPVTTTERPVIVTCPHCGEPGELTE